MMRLITAILVAVVSVSSDCGEDLTLTHSSPHVTFETSNIPGSYYVEEKCSWMVSAPRTVTKWRVTCKLHHSNLDNCTLISFHFNHFDLHLTICGEGSISKTFKGSTSFTLRSSAVENSMTYMGFTCSVSYNPEDILPDTSSINHSCTCGKKGGQRIIGGIETTSNEYPWQALLIYKSSRSIICGGSIIARKWVLSASHCVNELIPSNILVVLGEHDTQSLNSCRQDFEVTEIIVHKKYWKGRAGHCDIALLKLSELVTFNQVISPICLPFNYRYYDFTNKSGTIKGWGRKIAGDNLSLSNLLEGIDQKIIMHEDCTTAEGYGWPRKTITRNMICGLAENGGPCKGDSGGPLVWKSESSDLYIQLGIAALSWEKCAYDMKPTVYVKVSMFLDWIEDKTGAKGEFCVKN